LKKEEEEEEEKEGKGDGDNGRYRDCIRRDRGREI